MPGVENKGLCGDALEHKEKGKTILALGIRDSSIELNVKVKKNENGENVMPKFPESFQK